MLRYIKLTNFRGFKNHKIEFLPQSIIIGRNNAGKTTTIEALRIISVCQLRARSATFTARPQWLEGVCEGSGFHLSLEIIDFDFANVHHSYDTDSPAVLVAKFRNSAEIHVFLGKDSTNIFCQIRSSSRNIIHSRAELARLDVGLIKVMPPIGSIIQNERPIARDRLRRYMDGYLSYRHFRNQLWEMQPEYRRFRELLETTWNGLQIQAFENDHGSDGNQFSLLIREGRFTSEIGWHGQGLQAWAQTIWFLSRTQSNTTIVLDEPDVYLHAELQRKLIKVIESIKFNQMIIATHSAEIISDVPFRNVIGIQKKETISRPAIHAADIQKSLRLMGSIHSIHLSKLAEKGLILFVEGGDEVYLSDIAFKVGVHQFDRFSKLAIHVTNGKGNWVETLASAKSLYDSSNGDIKTAALFDRDYMIDEQEATFFERADPAKTFLKLWSRKEIENYFICSSAIARYINNNSDRNYVTSTEEIDLIIREIENNNSRDLALSIGNNVRAVRRHLDMTAAYNEAEHIIEHRRANGLRIIDMLSGKDAFSNLSAACQDRFGVSFSPLSICKELYRDEVPDEMVLFINNVCEFAERI